MCDCIAAIDETLFTTSNVVLDSDWALAVVYRGRPLQRSGAEEAPDVSNNSTILHVCAHQLTPVASARRARACTTGIWLESAQNWQVALAAPHSILFHLKLALGDLILDKRPCST